MHQVFNKEFSVSEFSKKLEVDKKYGSKEDLLELTKAFRKNGIYLMLDFVVNHTSNEFSWAKKAKKATRKAILIWAAVFIVLVVIILL